MGDFQEIQTINRQSTVGFDAGIYAFTDGQTLKKLIVVNFSGEDTSVFELKIPAEVITKWELKDGDYAIKDQLYSKSLLQLKVVNGVGKVQIKLLLRVFHLPVTLLVN
jgi:hypothetical protein